MDMRKRIRNVDPIIAITVVLVIAALVALIVAIGPASSAA
jgi:uncharacterized membrane protein